MTHKTKTPARRRRFTGRLPAFLPVPLRGRHNGWTDLRQGDFIGELAETGSVTEAARRVGMSRKGAYQLREKPGAEGFAAAWDVALGLPLRKVTVSDLARLAFKGKVRPIMRGGIYRGTAREAQPSALLQLLDRLDRASLRRAGLG